MAKIPKKIEKAIKAAEALVPQLREIRDKMEPLECDAEPYMNDVTEALDEAIDCIEAARDNATEDADDE